MSMVRLTVRQIKNLGLWEKVCDYKGWDYYLVNEGRIDEDEVVEFDDEFKVEEEEESWEEQVKGKTIEDVYVVHGDVLNEGMVELKFVDGSKLEIHAVGELGKVEMVDE